MKLYLKVENHFLIGTKETHAMKTKKLVRKMYLACVRHDKKKQKKLWLKSIKKSLKKKHTEVIQ